MLHHYLKTGFRTLYRQPVYALINILGLSTGLASFILILLFLQNELSYEQHIADSGRIYRLVEIQRPAGIDVQHVALTSGPWAAQIRRGFPGIVAALRVMPVWGGLYEANGRVFAENNAYFSEDEVFRFFNLEVLAGQPENALSELHTAVVSERIAATYFNTLNVVGETLRYGNQPYTITGLIKNQTENSHLNFDIILSYKSAEELIPDLKLWDSNFLSTYLLLQEGVLKADAEDNLQALIDLHLNEAGMPDATRPDMYLQAMREIHLQSGHIKFSIYNTRGDIRLIYLFSVVAFLILVIACINYINLSTARSAQRAKEVGIRKVLGAEPGNLVLQFIGESVILAFVSLIIAISLVEIILPDFNALLGTQLSVDFTSNRLFNVGLLGLLLMVGLLAGTYPAFYLNRFQPANVLKNLHLARVSSAWMLRKILVVFQFATSVVLIFSTLVISNQWRFMTDKDLGINYQNIISLHIRMGNPSEAEMDSLKARLLSSPAIINVAMASGTNGVAGSQGPVIAIDSVKTPLMVRFGFVDHDFFPAMEIPVVQGRNFSKDNQADQALGVMLNQAAANALNWTNAVGRKFESPFNPEEHLMVLGVVRDYNFFSLHGSIEPAFFFSHPERLRTIIVRYNQKQKDEALIHARQVWTEFFPRLPFEPEFATQNIVRQYRAEANTMRVFRYFSWLCIIISALGLFGLTAFVAELKRREIGIRKVHGATIADIVLYLQKDFMPLVFLAFMLSAPLAWLLMKNWLYNFAYRIEMSWWHFAMAFAAVWVVALLTIIYNAWKVAKANPVESLKCE